MALGVPAELSALVSRVADVRDPVAWHNLAAAEGDRGSPRNAELAARHAIEMGLQAPETRLVLARALQSQGLLDEAERFFREALAARPLYLEAHRDLAQLLWMRGGDRESALAPLGLALRASPREPGLCLVQSIVLEFTGALDRALDAALAGLSAAPRHGALLRQAAHLHAEDGRPESGIALARQAVADGVPDAEVTLCELLLALGEARDAEATAARLCAAQPANQHALALRATAWRILGDPRYAALFDYEAFVQADFLEVPAGETFDDFVESVARDVEGLHQVAHHPLQQSVRGGSQLTLDASHFARERVRALFAAIDAVIRRYLERLGTGPDVFRSRNSGRFAVTGAWSVRLRSGGYHTDHVHQMGWLSSACYLRVPPTIGAQATDRSGWLRLGKPGVRTRPVLEAEHFIRPEPGKLALFPAYMWHGVEPFTSESPRLSVAFDVVPR